MNRSALLLVSLLAAATTAAAQPPAAEGQPALQAVRGVVTALDATHVTVKPKAGPPVVVDLTPTWTVSVTKPVDISQIQVGSFIGSAEMPQADGRGRSLEVHVFPPGVKMGEGHYDWTLRKKSKMTNGTVGKVTTGAHGRELEVSYPNGDRKLVVSEKTPVVQIVPGDRAMIKPGAKIFLMGFPKPGGGMIAGSIAVGEKGAAPPM